MVVEAQAAGDARKGFARHFFGRHPAIRSEARADDIGRCWHGGVRALAGDLGADAGVLAHDPKLTLGATCEAFDSAARRATGTHRAVLSGRGAAPLAR